MKKAEREIFLKNRLEELKTIENQLRAEGFQYIAGVDEVGRGPLAGPVVAAAVVLPADFDVLGVDDSKKLSEKKRNELFDAMKIDAVEKPQQSLIKGDSRSISIAAASIVAKVTRDRQMIDYHRVYPHYGFESNKGYGTKAHYEGIVEHGITPIHRKTFLKNIIR